jgi:hypothetical protein
MREIRGKARTGLWGAAFFVVFVLIGISSNSGRAAAAPSPVCTKVVIEGEVNAGQEWRQDFGDGWVFRMVPIQPGNSGYSGWDLVVDRDPPAGFPDALLLATPPYNSINEREVGTTFKLRAQDAIGWNPRSFRFLTDPAAFQESQKLFAVFAATKRVPAAGSSEGKAMQRQLVINQKASAGQFRILNARLTPGTADAAPYAENWAMQSVRTPHTLTQSSSSQATPLGRLDWISFSITLWLPNAWEAPRNLEASHSSCSE